MKINVWINTRVIILGDVTSGISQSLMWRIRMWQEQGRQGRQGRGRPESVACIPGARRKSDQLLRLTLGVQLFIRQRPSARFCSFYFLNTWVHISCCYRLKLLRTQLYRTDARTYILLSGRWVEGVPVRVDMVSSAPSRGDRPRTSTFVWNRKRSCRRDSRWSLHHMTNCSFTKDEEKVIYIN